MRQSNIELCRIVAMMLVLTVHSSFATFGSPNEWDKPYFGLIFAEAMSVVGVNVFVLISGYFSIKLKKQSVIKLLYCCLFYAVVSFIFSYVNHAFSPKQLLFVSEANWFIAAYIGLMLLSPILNSYAEHSSKQRLGITIVMLLVFQTWYEYVPKLIPNFHGGYSILSFCILYLLARYLRLYPLGGVNSKKSLIVYAAITFTLAAVVYAISAIGFKVRVLSGEILKYNAPLVILSSVSLFLAFTKLEIDYSSVINHLAKSCIAVLLIHTSAAFFPYFGHVFKYIFWQTSGIVTVVLWIIAVICIYFICALIDQIRIFIENKISIK